MSDDHLVLDFEPLSNAFQDAGQAIRVGNPRIHRIDVSWPSFLAREDLPLVELPPQRLPREVVTPREETASSCLSFKAEIDQFHFEKDKEENVVLMIRLSDFEDKLDRQSATHSPRLIITHVDPSFEKDEEMDINPRKVLKGLLATMSKGRSSKDAPKS